MCLWLCLSIASGTHYEFANLRIHQSLGRSLLIHHLFILVNLDDEYGITVNTQQMIFEPVLELTFISFIFVLFNLQCHVSRWMSLIVFVHSNRYWARIFGLIKSLDSNEKGIDLLITKTKLFVIHIVAGTSHSYTVHSAWSHSAHKCNMHLFISRHSLWSHIQSHRFPSILDPFTRSNANFISLCRYTDS